MNFMNWIGNYGGKLCEFFQTSSVALLALPQLQRYGVELMVISIIAKQAHNSFFPDPQTPAQPPPGAKPTGVQSP
jgi:hypothetical protein